ncbi:hypothetical protein ES703_110797 [subsurface metagenome]
MKCKRIVIQHYTEIEQELDNWFMQNQDKNIQFITHTYIPVDRTPVDKEGKYEETPAFHLYTIFFEGPL